MAFLGHPPLRAFQLEAFTVELEEFGRIALPTIQALVVGDEAVVALEPSVVGRWLRRRGTTVFHCPRAAPYARVVDWALACPGEVVEAVTLRRRLEEARLLWLGQGLRPALSWESWFPRRLAEGAFSARLLTALTGAESLTDTSAWSARMGCSSSALRRSCRTELGLAPREVVALFRQALVDAARGQGQSWSAAAQWTGYAHESALRRALRGWKPRLPGLRERAAAWPCRRESVGGTRSTA